MILLGGVPSVGSEIEVIDFNQVDPITYLVRSITNNVMERVDVSTGEIDTTNLHIEISQEIAQNDDRLAWINAATGALEDAPASPLGNNTNNSSPFADTTKYRPNSEDEKRKFTYRRSRRRIRYKLRDVARDILYRLIGDDENIGQSPTSKKWRTCSCGVNRRNAGSDVTAKYEDGKAHYDNLVLCGSVHLCPVCAYKISRKRAIQIAETIEKFKKEHPNGRILLLTYTLQHALGDELKTLIKDLKTVLDSSRSGKFHKTFIERFNVDGYIRGMEIRANRVNGWHPHAHELLFVTDCDLNDEELIEEIDSSLGARYRHKLEKLGYETNEHTFDVRVTDGVEEYLTKSSIQLEVTNGQDKESKAGYQTYSPFQLLSEYDRTGDRWFADMFGEYAIATFRKRQMTFSRGLLARYEVDEQTDEEIVNERETLGVDVVSIPYDVWCDINRRKLSAALLDVIEDKQGSTEAVARWMIEKGLVDCAERVRPPRPPTYDDS